jgi:type I restriction enzyme S subunit
MARGSTTWKRVKLGDIVERHVQRARDVAGYTRFVGVDDLDTEDLRLRRHGEIGVDEIPPTFRFVFREGLTLVPTRRPRLRKCAVAPFEGLTGEKVLVLKPIARSDLHPGFVQHLLASPAVQNWNIGKEIGSVTPHFRWVDMAEFEFDLPPLDIQVHAARSFDALLRVDDSLRDAESCAQLQEHAFLNEHFSAENRQGVSVMEHVDALSGGTPSRSNGLYWNGAFPWLSPKDMKAYMLDDTSEHITDAAIADGHTVAPAGATFIVVRGMILQHTFPVCRARTPMAFNQDVKALVPRDGVDPTYLSLWFRWAAPHLLRLVSETSHGTKRLESDRLSLLPFSRAPIDVQRTFIDQFETVETGSKALRQRRMNATQARRSLIQTLRLP